MKKLEIGRVGITGYNSFVDASENRQELEIRLGIHVKASEYAEFLEQFLKDFQTFLDERK